MAYPVRLCCLPGWWCPPPGHSHQGPGYRFSSLINRDEPSLTGDCWLSPRAFVSIPLYSLAQSLESLETASGDSLQRMVSGEWCLETCGGSLWRQSLETVSGEQSPETCGDSLWKHLQRLLCIHINEASWLS